VWKASFLKFHCVDVANRGAEHVALRNLLHQRSFIQVDADGNVGGLGTRYAFAGEWFFENHSVVVKQVKWKWEVAQAVVRKVRRHVKEGKRNGR
jgi:hypothetical protein